MLLLCCFISWCKVTAKAPHLQSHQFGIPYRPFVVYVFGILADICLLFPSYVGIVFILAAVTPVLFQILVECYLVVGYRQAIVPF